MTSSIQPQTHLNQEPWWGRFDVEQDAIFSRRIGTLAIQICRKVHEWQVGYDRLEHDNDTSSATTPSTEGSLTPAEGANIERYVFARTQTTLQLTPALADRPVVSRPATPLHLPAKEEISIYVSSPLWVKVEVGDPPELLQEIPIIRPSDTWFGATTLEGELCYASRTSARLDFAQVPLRPDRAVTPVRIRNESDETLLLERLSLPVPHLSVFASNNGCLWTQEVTIMRRRGEEMGELKIGDRAPAISEGANLIAQPRLALERRTLVKTWTLLFG